MRNFTLSDNDNDLRRPLKSEISKLVCKKIDRQGELSVNVQSDGIAIHQILLRRLWTSLRICAAQQLVRSAGKFSCSFMQATNQHIPQFQADKYE